MNSKGKTHETLCNVKHSCKEYTCKKGMDKCIKDYNKSISDKLKTLHSGQPKEYWDKLKSSGKKNKR